MEDLLPHFRGDFDETNLNHVIRVDSYNSPAPSSGSSAVDPSSNPFIVPIWDVSMQYRPRLVMPQFLFEYLSEIPPQDGRDRYGSFLLDENAQSEHTVIEKDPHAEVRRYDESDDHGLGASLTEGEERDRRGSFLRFGLDCAAVDP
jgi:hypothetical protein